MKPKNISEENTPFQFSNLNQAGNPIVINEILSTHTPSDLIEMFKKKQLEHQFR